VAEAASGRGWGTRMVTPSPLPGPSGNVEFFVWLHRGPPRVSAADIAAVVHGGGIAGAASEKVDP
jgi:23S rRNA (cytidine1920-2'-O)/16S rRNA (cytidine1409-2'-O)-methyltransferase